MFGYWWVFYAQLLLLSYSRRYLIKVRQVTLLSSVLEWLQAVSHSIYGTPFARGQTCFRPCPHFLLAKVCMWVCDKEVNSTLNTRLCKDDIGTIDLSTTVVICSSWNECDTISDHCIEQLEEFSCEYTALDTDHRSNPLWSADHRRIKWYRQHLPDKLILKLGARVISWCNVDTEGVGERYNAWQLHNHLQNERVILSTQVSPEA